MKYYYNGKLIRTSKNHIYTHAVIDIADYECIGCRPSEDKAEAIIKSEIAQAERSIANCKSAIKALESGKRGYSHKEARRTWFHDFYPSDTIQRYTESIDRIEKYIEEVNSNWRVVELEMK